jgi:solute carrier family 35 protein E3
MKILGTPAIVFVQDRFYNTPTDNPTKLALVPICIGCAVAVVTDLEVNLIGTFWAIAAVASNTMYTIWGKSKMNELDANAMQILLYQSGTSAVMLMVLVPFFDDISLIRAYEYNSVNVTWIFISCLTAFLVNFSFFLMSGVTTPLTINVLGYVKTCIVFIGGFYIFAQVLDTKNIFGIILTLLGFLAYTWIKINPPAKFTGPEIKV